MVAWHVICEGKKCKFQVFFKRDVI